MSHPEVVIEQGKLRGTNAKNTQGTNFFKFQGIPYAKVPILSMRFKAPEPPGKFTDIFEATEEGDACYAKDPLKNGEIFGSENCLVLNVYTKILDEEILSPVLFWIHGGGFAFGSGGEEIYGPDFLINEDVVVVTINYRLGLLGFISFDDPSIEIPGNAGLKDQVMALKWVQKNISKFGGDPNNVTIFGESAGGASTHLLMLSPMAKGLFHKVITQSGCALNPWLDGINGTKIVAKAMGLEDADERTILKALLGKTVKEILEIQDKMADSGVPSERRPFGFVIEKNSKEPFLDKHPLEIMSSGNFHQVPFMIGFTSCEGMIYELHKKPNQDMLPLENVIPWFFGCEPDAPETRVLADKIKQFYFDGEEYSEKLLEKKYDIFSDGQFLYGIYVTITTHLQHSKAPIYVYRVSLETDLNFVKKFLKIETPGACHCDDIGYLFKVSIGKVEIIPDSKEDISIKKVVKLWTNFAKFGNPTPEKNDDLLGTTWDPATGPDFTCLDIDTELVNISNPYPERFKFWTNLFSESPAAQNSLKD